MTRYWVVSANVNNLPSTLQPWIRRILLNESAYMGWSNRYRIGKIFAEIRANDVLLIGHGPMTNHGAGRRLVACGRVTDNRTTKDPRVPELGHSQFAQLHPFVSLNEDPAQNGISLKGTPYDGNNQPWAVFELRRDDMKHPGSKDICDWLDRKLRNSRSGSLRNGKAPTHVIANIVNAGIQANAEGYQVRTRKQLIQAIRREQLLVQDFQHTLRLKGIDSDRRQYKTGEDILYCDLYQPTQKHLIEAKASARREDVRMAIGQLLDYENLTRAAGLGKSKLAVLLPERPSKGVEKLLDSVGIASIWRYGKTFQDNRGGHFL